MSVVAGIQELESRLLFDGLGVDVSTVTSPAGVELRITGTTGDDVITLDRKNKSVLITTRNGSMLYNRGVSFISIYGGGGDDRITIKPNIWTDAALYGGDGDDTLTGGTGNDRLYGQAGADVLNGAGGDDVLIALGDDANDRMTGGSGLDSFWVDNAGADGVTDLSADETAAGAMHLVNSFVNDVTVEPGLTSDATGYADFSASPLFSRYGPQVDDVTQGQLGDCFMLAAIAAVAQANPEVIRQSMVDLGDGTYAVQFIQNSQDIYVHVDGQLPVDSSGGLIYAKKGIRDCIWAPIFEKAYAIERLGTNSYDALQGGFPGEIYEDLGLPVQSVFSADSPEDLLAMLSAAVNNGQAVTLGVNTAPDDSDLIAGHAYVVDDVQTDDSGNSTVILRNTWPCDDPDNSTISVSADDAMDAFWFASMADVQN